MHHLVPVLAAVSALLLPSVAVAQKVRVDFDHGADFTKYKTYKWVKEGKNENVSQLADQRIVAALEEEMAKKGLTKSEDNPDLLVGYQGLIKNETQLTTYSDGMGPGWGYGGRWGYGWGGSSISTTTSSTVPVGTLVFDMMDPRQKQLVFRGVATDTLSDKPEKNAKKILKAAKKIFEKYPPKA